MGWAAYLPSSINGGARSADEVAAQTTISAMNTLAPRAGDNGSATKAAQDSAVSMPTTMPSRPTSGRDPVGDHTHGGIGDREDGLIEHQEKDHAVGAIPTSAASSGK